MDEMVITARIEITEYADLDGNTRLTIDCGDDPIQAATFLGLLELAKHEVMADYHGDGDEDCDDD